MQLIKILGWILVITGFFFILLPYIQGFTGFITGFFVAGRGVETGQTGFNIFNLVTGAGLAVVGLFVLRARKTASTTRYVEQ